MRMRLCALATAQGDGARLLELTTGKHTARTAQRNASTQHGGQCSTLYANGVGVRATAASICAGASEWPVSCEASCSSAQAYVVHATAASQRPCADTLRGSRVGCARPGGCTRKPESLLWLLTTQLTARCPHR